MRRDDVAGVQEAARTLLRADPQSRPLADAHGVAARQPIFRTGP